MNSLNKIFPFNIFRNDMWNFTFDIVGIVENIMFFINASFTDSINSIYNILLQKI